MKAPGRNQLIVIIGGVSVLGCGLVSAHTLEPETLKTFLDFAGSFSWKVITAAVSGSALVKTAGLWKNGKKPEG